jgi:hypothetical protein
MKTNIIIVIIFFFFQVVSAQKFPRIGLEAGITFSRSADETNRTEYYTGFMSNTATQISFDTNPTPGFLGGISAEYKLNSNLRLSSGLIFQNVNTRYYITGSQTSDLGVWDFDEWGNEKSYKISVPVSAGYILPIGKLKPSVNLGARFNYYLNGIITQKWSNSYFSYFDSSTINWSDEGELDPFGPENEYFLPAKKFVCQLVVGFSTAIGQYFSVNFDYNFGLNNSCEVITVYKGNRSTSYDSEYYRISNSEITVSISYYLFHAKSY